jgi:hypothetical protein
MSVRAAIRFLMTRGTNGGRVAFTSWSPNELDDEQMHAPPATNDESATDGPDAEDSPG